MAREFTHPATKDITLDGVLHALNDPIRRQIVAFLAGCTEVRCNKSCNKIAPSTLSFHFRVLREAGLVRSKKVGIEVINILRKEDIEKRFPGLLKNILSHHKYPKSKK